MTRSRAVCGLVARDSGDITCVGDRVSLLGGIHPRLRGLFALMGRTPPDVAVEVVRRRVGAALLELAVAGGLVAVGRELVEVGARLVAVRARLIAVRQGLVAVGASLIEVGEQLLEASARPIILDSSPCPHLAVLLSLDGPVRGSHGDAV